MKKSHLQGVALLLLQDNLLDKKNAEFYQQAAMEQQLSLPQYLVDNGILSPECIAASIASHFGLQRIDLDEIDILSIPYTLVHEKLLQRHRIVPLFQEGNQLRVAVEDPFQHEALKDIQFHTGLHLTPLVVETHKLTRLIHQLLHQSENQGLSNLMVESAENEHSMHADEDQPVVKFVKRILLEAIDKNASDIHFEPYEDNYRIRYRQDGLLVCVASPPLSLSARIASRLKIMSNLNISERRLPQDGRFSVLLSDKKAIDCRVSTCPTTAGEKIVVRILDKKLANPDIEQLGLNAEQKTLFMRALARPQGMILVTGPTGSGKSMTLYSALASLNTDDKNISTIEDPVELNLHGINQVNINLKIGLTFANGLRAFLRQDPDVIMIGEIRDLETAEIAISASQTGHLVLSTLHTNSASETLSRLLSMGVPSFNIASSINLIVAQRLVRRLCDYCKQVRNDLTATTLKELRLSENQDTLFQSYKAQGCHRCMDGYRGRIALFEVMSISKQIVNMILTGKSPSELLEQAQSEGMITLLKDGIEKIKMGLTSIEEIIRTRTE